MMCLDGQWQAFWNALMTETEPQITSVGVSYMLQGDEGSNIDPFATEPTPDNEWVVSPAHLMIITPDASQLDALPTDPDNGPCVMWKDTLKISYSSMGNPCAVPREFSGAIAHAGWDCGSCALRP